MAHFYPWYFGAGLPLSFRTAITAFLALEPAAQTRIKEAIVDTDYPFRRRILREKARQLHEELKVLDAETLYSILEFITNFVSVPPTALADVLAQTFKDVGIPYAPLESLITELSSAKRFTDQRDIEEFKRLAVPTLRPIEYFCAMRSRYDKQFSYFDDNIESYNPSVVDRHPVIIVKLEAMGSSDELIFQLDQEQLDRLISELIAAQRQLKVLAVR